MHKRKKKFKMYNTQNNMQELFILRKKCVICSDHVSAYNISEDRFNSMVQNGHQNKTINDKSMRILEVPSFCDYCVDDYESKIVEVN